MIDRVVPVCVRITQVVGSAASSPTFFVQPLSAGRYKTEICRLFKAGHCKKGNSCDHAHGDADRRPRVVCLGIVRLSLSIAVTWG